MATEILINDGGAPARIIPFTAGSTVAAGRLVNIATDGEVDYAASGTTTPLGVSYTAATSGNIANVITGRGVMLNVSCSAAVTLGNALEVGGVGALQPGATADAIVAVALETNASAGYNKVLTL